MREVAVIGIGATKFGELWDLSFREIGIQAGLAAVYDANLSGEDIDALYVGNMSAGVISSRSMLAALDRRLLGHGPGQHPGHAGGGGRGVRRPSACAKGIWRSRPACTTSSSSAGRRR